jgi:Rab-like protein 2
MHPSYYHRAHACLLVFDITRKLSYQHLDHWHAELQSVRPGLPTVVAANKVDEDDSVTKKVFAFTKKRQGAAGGVVGGVRFVSAADGLNVVRTFKELIAIADEYRRKGNEADFSGEVMDALDYFERKEKKAAQTAAAAAGAAPQTEAAAKPGREELY